MRKTRKRALAMAFIKEYGRPPHRSELRRERKNYVGSIVIPYDVQRAVMGRIFANMEGK